MPTGDQTAFGDLLRRQRVAEGLTQVQLAERAGLSVRGVSDLERGIRRGPHRATVLRLADGLGLAETERALLSASARRSASVQAPVTDHASVVLPSVLTSFVGRQRELEAIGQLLISSRLLTLIGAGGIGKTRLALRAAADAAQLFSDGTHAVELAPLSDPDLLVHAVASALRIPEQRARPLSVTLIDRLRLKRLLLVLDNCEHLVESIARLADHLLRACSDVHILATSRESLGVAGEVVWRVPPLAMPDPARDVTLQDLVQTDAVRLFIERAQAVLPGFAETLNDRGIREVAKVCQQLDGIPLAIELAAARARVLAPEEIAERLQDRFSLLVGGSRTVPARHQTLRATVDWSYGLLSEAHRRLFDRLSVFAGSWTLRAAEAVCSGSGTEIRQVLDLITQLVDKSLVLTEPGTSGEMRYRMLETLREYAMEKLRERGETPEWRARHAAWFLALAEQAAPELRGPHQLRWLERLQLEYDNLRAALHWCLDGDGTIETGVKLAGALAGFWRIRGHVSEGQAWLERARARADEAPPSAHATLLNGSGELAQFQDRFGLARGLHEERGEPRYQAGAWRSPRHSPIAKEPRPGAAR